jgi:Rieske Fe-S protein
MLSVGAAPAVVRAMAVNFQTGTRADTWISFPLPSQDGVTIDKDNEIIIARHGANIFAFALSCPHQHTVLKWNAKDARFQCPKHKSQYDAEGTFISGRATRSMDRFPLKLTGAQIQVNADILYQEDDNPKEWQAAVVKV